MSLKSFQSLFGGFGVGSVVTGLNLRKIHGLSLYTMCRQTPEIVFGRGVSYSKYSRPNVFRFSDLIFFFGGMGREHVHMDSEKSWEWT